MEKEFKTEERSKKVTCEGCKKEHFIKKENLKLIASFHSYKLYSFRCPFCKKRDYIRDKQLPFIV